jgi:hypothetical protein
MKKTKVAQPSPPKSDPLKLFEENLDQIVAFFERMSAAPLERTLKRAIASVVALAKSAPNIDVKRIAKSVQAASKATDRWLAFYLPASRWVTVMLVSFLEAYLEDVLKELASKNPAIVKSKDGIPVTTIILAGSLEELKEDIIRNWAHDQLRPDGPARWYRVLRDLGASPSLSPTLLSEMQHLWDTRNLIVHARCVPDKVYARKHGNRGAVQGTVFRVNSRTLQAWLPHVKDFVNWTDNFLLNYGKAKLPSKTKAAPASA